MLKEKLFKHSNLVIFIFLAVVTSITQYILLKPVMSTGFALDDWGAVLTIKSLMPIAVDKIFYYSWIYLGMHHAMQFFYIATLFTLFGFNYPTYNIVNIILKIIATLSIFPLIILIFKRKSLAVLTTIIYAISYSATGALTYVLQGVYYIGIIFMNIFFIFYYGGVTKNSKIQLFLACLSLILAYWFAPGRIYPIFAFILLIEFFLNFRYGFKKMIKGSVIRLTLFYMPILLLMLTGKKDYSQLGTPSQTFQDVANGNWRVILNPLSGLGYLLLPGDYWTIFGNPVILGFGDYFDILMKENFLVLIPLTIILSLIISKNIFKFSFLILAINFIISILIFFVATHHLSIPVNLRVGWDEFSFWKQQYFTLFGVYILTISCVCFWSYWKNKNKVNWPLLAAAIGPVFAFIFLIGMWLILGRVMTFYIGVNRYFPFASLGASLFVAAILVQTFDRASRISAVAKVIAKAAILLCLFFIFQISSKEIDIGFHGANVRNSYLHQHFQENFMTQVQVEKIKDKNSVLFYFDLPDERQEKYFEQAIDLSNFSRWMYLRLEAKEDKCIGVISDEAKLKEAVKVEGGKSVLFHPNSGCIGRWDKISSYQTDKEISYEPQNFFAYRVTGDNFADVTDEFLQKLQLK